MDLNIKTPIAFFDLEATGINISTDRIVEISILKIFPDSSQELKTLKINPTVPIPIETSLIHGIYDKDVEDAPTFKDVAKELFRFLKALIWQVSMSSSTISPYWLKNSLG